MAIAEPDFEGVENPGGDGWGDYPLDSVFVRTEARTVSSVVERIENKRYILDPDFQREFVWSADDLPLNFHPAAVRASANVTPFGAMSVPA
jgi:hypothetical protein